ncbi:hypothetical protein A9Q02_13455 [Candidatus Chloroploca asiatica]|uniref:Uncharacterized protein n=2 Tax=Candidatus Chloroploca asiatica TaxID=1506545 RepID=A0A2H3KNV5_9CHLR|nr:hypothetical protein A9Q02_13455 [Candidatus Chloroploca asiatica]
MLIYSFYNKSIIKNKELVLTSIILFVIAIAMPFTFFMGMGAVDQRFGFIAMIVLALGFKTTTVSRTVNYTVLAIIMAFISAHGVIFQASDRQLSAMYESIQAVPSGESVYSLSIRQPPIYGNCSQQDYLNIGNGIFPLQWFSVYSVIYGKPMPVHTFSTAALTLQKEIEPALKFEEIDPTLKFNLLQKFTRENLIQIQNHPPRSNYIFLFGCSSNIYDAASILSDSYDTMQAEKYLIVMKAKPLDN